MIIAVLMGLAVIILFYGIGSYNSLIILKTRIEEALSGIDVQLKRRADLIPDLVGTVKGYAKHEKEILENVTKARSQLLSAENVKDKIEANDSMSNALKSLFAVAEAYPQLQASENFKELQRQLEDTEDKIAYSRQFYNTNVLEYNSQIRIFPSSVIANVFLFKEFEFFQAQENEKKKTNVSF